MTSPLDAVRATCGPVHDLGSAWMIHPDTFAVGAEQGYANPFAYYFAGRGGVLGDVDASVVGAAMGYFEPGLLRAMWDEGVAVHGARAAARNYAEAARRWGRHRVADAPGLGRFVELSEQLLARAEPSGLPLYAGWCAEPREGTDAERALQLVHILREWRFGLHLAATTAQGLAPIEAIVARDGIGQAKFFGWTEFPEVTDDLRARRDAAEDVTDQLCALAYGRAFDADELTEYVEVTASVTAAANANADAG